MRYCQYTRLLLIFVYYYNCIIQDYYCRDTVLLFLSHGTVGSSNNSAGISVRAWQHHWCFTVFCICSLFIALSWFSVIQCDQKKKKTIQIQIPTRQCMYQGADKSLARPGSKQATQKKFRRWSIQPGLCGSNDLHVGRKMATFQLFFFGQVRSG